MHCVIETESFAKAAKEAGLSEDEHQKIVNYLSENPTTGELIRGTGGARKVRFPYRGHGKSTGCRVITYYAADEVPLFLLDVYSKGERISLSKEERNEMKSALKWIADDYRQSIQERVKKLEIA